MTLHHRLAAVVDDWAAFERKHEAERMLIARLNHPYLIVPCEGCQKVEVVHGGLCPDCLSIVAGAVRGFAKGRR